MYFVSYSCRIRLIPNTFSGLVNEMGGFVIHRGTFVKKALSEALRVAQTL